MENYEIEARQDSAMMLRGEVVGARKQLKIARGFHSDSLAILAMHREKLNTALSRLEDLKAGRGALLDSEGSVKVYEFWVELPGYRGPIKGATAQLTHHGSLQQVSDVSSKSKSGLGGGIVGGLLLGPLGAAAGVLATRKNQVHTQIREVDTRQLEFAIQGPGFAWSTISHFSMSNRLREFRDLINSRASINESLDVLCQMQSKIVSDLRKKAADASSIFASDESKMKKIEVELDAFWKEYTASRLSLIDELKFRLDCISRPLQIFAVIVGPALLFAWVAVLLYGWIAGEYRIILISVVAGLLQLFAWSAAFVYYMFSSRL